MRVEKRELTTKSFLRSENCCVDILNGEKSISCIWGKWFWNSRTNVCGFFGPFVFQCKGDYAHLKYWVTFWQLKLVVWDLYERSPGCKLWEKCGPITKRPKSYAIFPFSIQHFCNSRMKTITIVTQPSFRQYETSRLRGWWMETIFRRACHWISGIRNTGSFPNSSVFGVFLRNVFIAAWFSNSFQNINEGLVQQSDFWTWKSSSYFEE